MPTTDDPGSDSSEEKVADIYIARGDETLGPYDPVEAAALVVSGYLHADDHAARNGDSAWVPLADFLPPSSRQVTAADPSSPAPAPSGTTPPPRWRRLVTAFLLLAVVSLLVAGGVRWFEHQPAVGPSPAATPLPPPVPAATPSPTPTVAVTPVIEAPTPPPTPVPDGPLHGSLAVPLAGVRVTAYPLEVLKTTLAPTISAAQAARERLDPQIDAADAEHTAHAAEEQSALKTLNEAAPNDPLRRSLRFAYTWAKAATRTAADNHRFLLEERASAAGGEVYFRALPTPAVAAETDATGSFTLDLPSDGQPYAVAASAPPAADVGGTRPRYWLVRLSDPQRSGHEALRLDDGNTVSSSSDASLVHTAD